MTASVKHICVLQGPCCWSAPGIEHNGRFDLSGDVVSFKHILKNQNSPWTLSLLSSDIDNELFNYNSKCAFHFHYFPFTMPDEQHLVFLCLGNENRSVCVASVYSLIVINFTLRFLSISPILEISSCSCHKETLTKITSIKS